MATIKQYDVWLADLTPRYGTEAGKLRPVVIVQNNLLNEQGHPSTIICPVTTNIIDDADPLRVRLSVHEAGTLRSSDIMVEQLRSIDNQRFVEKIGSLHKSSAAFLRDCIAIVLGI